MDTQLVLNSLSNLVYHIDDAKRPYQIYEKADKMLLNYGEALGRKVLRSSGIIDAKHAAEQLKQAKQPTDKIQDGVMYVFKGKHAVPATRDEISNALHSVIRTLKGDNNL